jgi:hypothetical protein
MYVVHGHQPLPAKTGHKSQTGCTTLVFDMLSIGGAPRVLSRNLKRGRHNQPWETAVARQVVLTPTGSRPVLIRADQCHGQLPYRPRMLMHRSLSRSHGSPLQGLRHPNFLTSCQAAPGAERRNGQRSGNVQLDRKRWGAQPPVSLG